jgi:hypothetical protein
MRFSTLLIYTISFLATYSTAAPLVVPRAEASVTTEIDYDTLLFNGTTNVAPAAATDEVLSSDPAYAQRALATGQPPYYDLGYTLRSSWGTVDKKYPIVLVHGFAGFGKPLLGVLNYFGGLTGDGKHSEGV